MPAVGEPLMPALAVFLVVLTTIANAAALVLQRKAGRDSVEGAGPRAGTLRDVVRRPSWVAGQVIFVVAVGLQVTALTLGSITLVQPVLVLALPFTLLLGWFVLGGAIGRDEWVSIAMVSVGLVVLLASVRPRGGDALGAGTAVWVAGTVVTLGLMAVFAVAAVRSRGAATRAGCFGIAAGLGSGFVAVIVKAMSDALVLDGPLGVATTWQSWLLLPTAPAAYVALQLALRAGRLIASQPGLVLANPLLAASWGMGLLGEQVRGGVWLVGGVAGAGLVVVGVVLLARSPLVDATDSGPRVPGGPAAGSCSARTSSGPVDCR